jgi:DNA-binding GntR family transcriptional regulator
MESEDLNRKEHLDNMELLVTETRDNVRDLTTHLEDISKRDGVNAIELLVRDILGGLEELKDRAAKDSEDLEKVTKTDVEAVEAVCLDVKTTIEQMVASDLAALASKEDVKNLEELVKEFKGRMETHAATNAKAFVLLRLRPSSRSSRMHSKRSLMKELPASKPWANSSRALGRPSARMRPLPMISKRCLKR